MTREASTTAREAETDQAANPTQAKVTGRELIGKTGRELSGGTRTGAGKEGTESTRDMYIMACSAAETTAEIEAGNVVVREAEGTLERKGPVRNTTFACKSPASNALS
jgi:hypothetical protein